MENVVVTGSIMTMSNKNDSKFKQEIPTKTAYLKVDASNARKLIDFGLTQYTAEETKEDFFIVKTVRELACYNTSKKQEKNSTMDMTTDTGISVKTVEGKEIMMNIIKGENMGNEFYRLQAIKISKHTDLEQIVATNPFALDE